MAVQRSTSHDFLMAQDEDETQSRAMGLFITLIYRAHATDASNVDALENMKIPFYVP